MASNAVHRATGRNKSKPAVFVLDVVPEVRVSPYARVPISAGRMARRARRHLPVVAFSLAAPGVFFEQIVLSDAWRIDLDPTPEKRL